MLKAIIVDNEKPAIDVLNILLERTGQVSVLNGFLNAAAALSDLHFIKPDVAFLDIEMPEINGLELAEKILAINHDIEIVFVTAYDQYALEAFRVNALNYLLKPLSPKDIEQTVARLIKRKRLSSASPDDALRGQIYCFGKLSVYECGDEGPLPIKWRTSKAEELFAYMLQNKNAELSKWVICEALWPEHSAEKVDIYLHTTLYKMKKSLTSAKINFDIKFNNGCYSMSLYNVFIDTVVFDSIVDSDIVITEDTLQKYRESFFLYKNGYFEGNDYLWSLPKKELYYKKYYRLATHLVKYYMQKNNFTATEEILLKVLEKSPLDERAHEMLLEVYFIKKDRVSFITHYNIMRELLKNELGIEPNHSIYALYKNMNFNY